ncbi:MAG: hypothetical protein ACJ71T_03385 [Actinomycetales bacterium]
MGKYEQLERHLSAVDSGPRLDMSFDEVARWIPGGLPSTAYRRTGWWAGSPNETHVRAKAWTRSGWVVRSVDLRDRSVTFERVNGADDHDARDELPLNGANGSGGEAPVTHRMEHLAALLSGGWVTGLVGGLEEDLDGADADTAVAAAELAGVTTELLTEAITVRRHLGQLNDLIHATAITLALPRILEPGEAVVSRPALETTGERSNRFDLETDRRVADFQIGVWTGKDAIRKRMVFQDLVHLAAHHSGRRAELYVAGEAPLTFLRESRSPVSWALNFGPTQTRELFVERFGDTSLPIAAFTKVAAAHVKLVDLTQILPQVQSAVLSA